VGRIVAKLTEFVGEFEGKGKSGILVSQTLKDRLAEMTATKKIFLHAEIASDYCLEAFPIGAYADLKYPVLTCLANIHQEDSLHRNICVDFGVYGTMSLYDSDSAILSDTSA
jgi:Zn-dependent M16 (insulinase) family peptidase